MDSVDVCLTFSPVRMYGTIRGIQIINSPTIDIQIFNSNKKSRISKEETSRKKPTAFPPILVCNYLQNWTQKNEVYRRIANSGHVYTLASLFADMWSLEGLHLRDCLTLCHP